MTIPAEVWGSASALALLVGAAVTRAMSNKLVRAWKQRAEDLETQCTELLAKLRAREEACERCPHRRAVSDSLPITRGAEEGP